MEITILQKNEIPLGYFDTLSLFEYQFVLKNPCYGNFEDLDTTKCKIDTLDRNLERIRRAAVKYLHVYELVKVVCKKTVISRAYFKLYEMIYSNEILQQKNLDCFFICEAPGGFIECILDIRRKKNQKVQYLSISKEDPDIKYDKYLEENNLLHGDLTNLKTIHQTINTVLDKFPGGLDIVTADGGFEVKSYNDQEICTSKLILCEIYTAMSTQKIGGTFIIKFFDMFTHNSIVYYLILCSCYECVKIIKPKTSRNCNSERYLVCLRFRGMTQTLNISLQKIIYYYTTVHFKVFPNVIIPEIVQRKLCLFNNLIVNEQIKTIDESIKMVYSKDLYIQNLLLKIFLENKIYTNFILLYKNILQSRIKLCTDFLRNYSINIRQFN